MKTLLLPTDTSDAMASAIATAGLLARHLGAKVEAVASRPSHAEFIAPDPIVAVSIPPPNWDETGYVRSTRAIYDAGLRALGDEAGRFRWRGGETVEDPALGMLARTFDATIFSRPGPGGSRMTAFEAVLFESGRPLLMAPHRAPQTFGQTIMVHWNRSTETARATALAMPLLKLAKRVILVSVEGNEVPGPSARDALANFEAHGIAVSEKTIASRPGPGEALLAEAQSLGADLLVKGAYTQSRLRQMIFGGATSHILARAEIPVLFAH
jgi:nucleotide-binding universal stress UspA family protein